MSFGDLAFERRLEDGILGGSLSFLDATRRGHVFVFEGNTTTMMLMVVMMKMTRCSC